MQDLLLSFRISLIYYYKSLSPDCALQKELILLITENQRGLYWRNYFQFAHSAEGFISAD